MNSSGCAVMETSITKEEPVDIYSSDLSDMKRITTEQQVETYSSSAVIEAVVAKRHFVKTERIMKDEEIIEINSVDLNMDKNTTAKQLVETYLSDPDDVKECIIKITNTGGVLSKVILNEDSDDIFSEGDSGENKTELIDITKIKMKDVDIELGVERNVPLKKTMEEISNSENSCLESSKKEDCIQNYIKSEEIEIKTVETDNDSEDDRFEEKLKKWNKYQDDENTKFKCHQCQKAFNRKHTLFYHINTKHLQFEKYQCNYCLKVFLRKDYLNQHISSIHLNTKHSPVKKYQCNYCLQGFSRKGSLKQHISSIHLKLEPYICEGCKKTFSHKYFLHRHIVSNHQENLDLMKMVTGKIYNCDHCTFKSLQNDVMENHQKTHGIRLSCHTEFKCPHCQKIFSRKHTLIYHINTKHSALEKYECNYCLQGFVQKGSLKHHISSIHLKIKPHICKDCKKTFSRKHFLDFHIVSRHQKNLDLMKMVAGKIHSCEHCTYKSLRNDVMKNHLKTHGIHLPSHAKLTCPQCQKNFRSKRNFENHLLNVHDNLGGIVTSKIHSCNICSFKTILKTKLKAHISTVHLNLKPYICKGCKKSFRQKFTLDSHIVSRHQKNLDLLKTVTSKIYNCDHCTFKSLKNYDINRHIKTHGRHV